MAVERVEQSMSEQGRGKGYVVLIADDDPDDRALAADALEMSRSSSEVRFVADGEELLDYLRHEGPYEEESAPRPDLILLDLNMPKRSGTEALAEIRRTRA
jgi:CheY-like chemotaxis protein